MKTALPEYIVRHSPKAKHLRLKVTREDGLCVVIPRGYDEKRIPALLKQKRVWIAEALNRVSETRRFLEPTPAKHLPAVVRLAALGETWEIIYRENGIRSGISLRTDNGKLIVSGFEFDRADVLRKLRAWPRVRVREGLFPVTENLATKYRLTLEGLMVKNQRTRWASCSAKRNLALNIKLLFLPPDLVRYVLIHELCHTVHMNHSKEFWRLLASREPSYKTLDQGLREAWKVVPVWAFER